MSAKVIKTIYFHNTVIIPKQLLLVTNLFMTLLNTNYYLMVKYVPLFETNNAIRWNFAGFCLLSCTFNVRDQPRGLVVRVSDY